MRKSKIFAALLLTLCFVMIFSSCGASATLKYVDMDYDETKDPHPLATATQLTSISGVNYGKKLGSLIVFEDNGVEGVNDYDYRYQVYNVDTNTVVFDYKVPFAAPENTPTTLDITLKGVSTDNGKQVYAFIVEYYNAAGKVVKSELYNAAGGAAVANATKSVSSRIVNDLLIYNSVAYKVLNGALTKAFDVSDFIEIDSIFAATEDYLYVRSQNVIRILDMQYNIVGGYTIPEYSGEAKTFVLSNGNILCQYYLILPENANKYDIIETNEMLYTPMKVDLVTVIYDIENDKVKEVDADFVIEEMSSSAYKGFDKWCIVDDGKTNAAVIQRIEDKRVDRAKTELVVLDNKGEIKASIDDVCKGATSIEVVADNLIKVKDRYGAIHLINNKGDIIKSISGAAIEGFKENEKYIVSGRIIYDAKNLSEVYNYEANGYEYYSKTDTAIFLKKVATDGKVEYAKFDGTLSVVIAADSTNELVTVVNKYYCVKSVVDGVDKYTYFSTNGTQLAVLDYQINILHTSGDGNILATVPNGAGGVSYYRFAVAATA